MENRIPERTPRAKVTARSTALGMLIAVISVLFECCLSFEWVIIGLLIGSIIGAISARMVQMTAMPQLGWLDPGLESFYDLVVNIF